MNKTDESVLEETPIAESQETPAEPVVETPEPEAPQLIHRPIKGYFFPNPDEQLPFGGEFATSEEAESANTAYLETHKKASK